MVDLLESLWNEYMLVSVLVIGISIALLSIIYQIGKMLSNKKMVDWARYEVYQSLGSMVIIAVVFLVLASINSVLLLAIEAGHEGDPYVGFKCFGSTCTYSEYTMPPGEFQAPAPTTVECSKDCHIELAKSYLNSTFNVVRYYAASQVCMAGWITLMSDSEMSFRPFKHLSLIGGLRGLRTFTKYLPAFSFVPFGGCQLVDQSYEFMISSMTDLLGVLKGNWIMMNLVQYAIFPLFLVLGIILRSVSPTRKLGGLLIAIALVLYFFYPAVVILQGVLISPNEQLLQLNSGCPAQKSILGEQTAGGWNPITKMFLSVKDANGNNNPICPAAGFMVVGYDGIFSMTAAITVWVTVQFIITIYLVAMMIMELSPLFGGDVEVAGISRLL
jgi:hypothetical protein